MMFAIDVPLGAVEVNHAYGPVWTSCHIHAFTAGLDRSVRPRGVEPRSMSDV